MFFASYQSSSNWLHLLTQLKDKSHHRDSQGFLFKEILIINAHVNYDDVREGAFARWNLIKESLVASIVWKCKNNAKYHASDYINLTFLMLEFESIVEYTQDLAFDPSGWWHIA